MSEPRRLRLDSFLGSSGIKMDSESPSSTVSTVMNKAWGCKWTRPLVPTGRAKLDASKLVVKHAEELRALPVPGQPTDERTDHMLWVTYDPVEGWSCPEIKPYDWIKLDPAASCLSFGTNCFEGMKAVLDSDDVPRLFRPQMNVQRLLESAVRLALPIFDPSELLKLIMELVLVERRWILPHPGACVYIRIVLIGTRPGYAPLIPNKASLYAILRPAEACLPPPDTGPIPTTLQCNSVKPTAKPLSLFAPKDLVRAFLGGTGEYKLSCNYAPTILPRYLVTLEGWSQVLWLNEDRVTESGGMNFFVVIKSEENDGELDIITPELDGTILPGIVRNSCLELLRANLNDSSVLPLLPSSRFRVLERKLTMNDLSTWGKQGRLVEAFCTGTAVGVVPVEKVGWEIDEEMEEVISSECPGNVREALFEKLEQIKRGEPSAGKVWEGWSVRCKSGRQ